MDYADKDRSREPSGSDRGGRPSRESERGRTAAKPQHIPALGWKEILVRSFNEISANNIFLAAGGVTYAVLLALFPALAAFVSIYGLLIDPAQIEKQVSAMGAVFPGQMQEMLGQQLHRLVSSSHGALGFGAVAGLLFALWSASRGTSGRSALDIAYEEKETRSFLRFNLVAILLTIVSIIGGIIAIALVAGLPTVVQFMGVGQGTKWLLLLMQWPVLIALWLVGLAVLYRYAPDRREAQWHWVSPGAICAIVLWIIASVLFTVYVANFSSYDKTYGSLGSVVMLLTWLYITSFVVLLGAVINAQSERQVHQDTTEGGPKPIGRRGAKAADSKAN
jgi:membrane protein